MENKSLTLLISQKNDYDQQSHLYFISSLMGLGIPVSVSFPGLPISLTTKVSQ